ncbi:unnamed protein product [Moneuplotes crassus]|uniref:Cyclic nucleotide-binding domain-containing protein n=1 Tax=Euplotes crassus TaxID=5936 RepID=A0AAD1UIB2_EUPCR|nr:unnamed protein product [Moneuplotes crassus]
MANINITSLNLDCLKNEMEHKNQISQQKLMRRMTSLDKENDKLSTSAIHHDIKNSARKPSVNSVNNQPKSLTRDILKVLTNNHRKRSDLLELKDFFKSHQFFSELEEKNGEETVLKCFRAMKYVQHAKNDILFKQGDEGYYFYIILKGKVGVKIMLTKENQSTQEQYHQFLLKNYKDICWDKTENGAALKLKVQALMNRPPPRVPKRSSKKLIKATQSFCLKNLKTFKTMMMKEVNVLGPGKCFGEVALINSSKRTATIYCKNHSCSFAILGRDDFKDIAGKAEKKKLEQKITFLKKYEIFQEFTYNTLRKFSYFMEEQIYSKGSKVYSEGDQPSGIFCVKEGNFEVIQKNPMKVKPKLKEKITNCSSKPKNLSVLKDLDHLRIASLRERDAFGVEEVLENVKRKNTVVCTSGGYSTVYFLPSKELLPLFNSKKSQQCLQVALNHQKCRNSRIKDIERIADKEERNIHEYETERRLKKIQRLKKPPQSRSKTIEEVKEKSVEKKKVKLVADDLPPDFKFLYKRKANFRKKVTKFIRDTDTNRSRNIQARTPQTDHERTFQKKSRLWGHKKQSCLARDSHNNIGNNTYIYNIRVNFYSLNYRNLSSFDNTNNSFIKIQKKKQKKLKQILSTEPEPKKRTELSRLGFKENKKLSPLKISKFHEKNGKTDTSLIEEIHNQRFDDVPRKLSKFKPKCSISPPISRNSYQFRTSTPKCQLVTLCNSENPKNGYKHSLKIFQRFSILSKKLHQKEQVYTLNIQNKKYDLTLDLKQDISTTCPKMDSKASRKFSFQTPIPTNQINTPFTQKVDSQLSKYQKSFKNSHCRSPDLKLRKNRNNRRHLTGKILSRTSVPTTRADGSLISDIIYKSPEQEKNRMKRKIIDLRKKFTQISLRQSQL